MKLDAKMAFTIFIGVIMVTSAVGMALSYRPQISSQGMKIENVYEELLTPQEKITILRSGRMLIEYLHTGGEESIQKRADYEIFISGVGDIVVLEVVEVSYENETKNEMLTPSGDVIPLHNVTADELMDVFCENTIVQPRACLLENI